VLVVVEEDVVVDMVLIVLAVVDVELLVLVVVLMVE